jgi:hypothetical protein
MVLSSAGVCVLVPAGQYASTSTKHLAVNCSSSSYAGAANCIKAVPYVSSVAGGRSTTGLFDGIGTQVRFEGPQAVVVDTSGNVYITDTSFFNIRVMNKSTGVWLQRLKISLPFYPLRFLQAQLRPWLANTMRVGARTVSAPMPDSSIHTAL